MCIRDRRTVYPAVVDNEPAAVAVSAVAPDGYAGEIALLIGISFEGYLTGVRVVTHQETPGLGDKIDRAKSNWIVSFDGKSILDDTVWSVKKDGGDFDQFTGATITPRAIVNTVSRTLQWYHNNRQRIFERR